MKIWILAAVALVVALSCGEPGSGGTACRDCVVTVVDGGVDGGLLMHEDCRPTDLQLTGTSEQGLSVVSLGTMQLTQEGQWLGAPIVESQEIGVCVPDGTASLALYSASAIVSEWRGSGNSQLNPLNIDELIRWENPEWSLPRSEAITVLPGRNVFKLGADSVRTVPVLLAIRRGAASASSAFRLNLVFVDGNNLTAEELNAVLQPSSDFRALYGQAGIPLPETRVGTIADSSLAVVAVDQFSGLSTATVTPSADPLFNDSATLFFVRQITSTDPTGIVLGEAMGVPGAPGVPGKGGVVVSLDGHRRNGALDTRALWTTVAHELGHWHGLRHTTEREGRFFDLLPDTPECPSSQDANHDGVVGMDECKGFGASNLMFWTYDLSSPPTVISPEQAFLLDSALTVVPR